MTWQEEFWIGTAKRIEDTTISNGMWWSIDLKTFYFIDKPTRELLLMIMMTEPEILAIEKWLLNSKGKWISGWNNYR